MTRYFRNIGFRNIPYHRYVTYLHHIPESGVSLDNFVENCKIMEEKIGREFTPEKNFECVAALHWLVDNNLVIYEPVKRN